MNTSLEKINALVEELHGLLPMKSENQQRLDKKMRLEFNYNSNHIEGNTLTYGETELLLIFGKTTGNHEIREYDEMKAHDAAFELIKDWAADDERPLTEMALKNLHKIILVEPFWKEAILPDGQPTRRLIKVGDYKEHSNSVRLQNGEMFDYALPSETPIQMGELIQWYKDEEAKKELHPVIIAALLHYKFVLIHPFDDGNGRISRLLMNYVLLKQNLPPVIVKSADKKNYLFALNQADTGNIGAFIEYISEQLLWSLNLYLKAAKGETLEESDDFLKEIDIWKKGVVTRKVKALHRNDALIYNIYHNGVRELFERFVEMHRRFFDLFQKNSSNFYRNNSGREGLKWLTEEINAIALNSHPVFFETSERTNTSETKDEYTNLFGIIHLQEFKYSENNSFSLDINLRVDLQPYKYTIQYEHDTLAEKTYTEYLNFGEIEQIVTACVQDVFKKIKINAGE